MGNSCLSVRLPLLLAIAVLACHPRETTSSGSKHLQDGGGWVAAAKLQEQQDRQHQQQQQEQPSQGTLSRAAGAAFARPPKQQLPVRKSSVASENLQHHGPEGAEGWTGANRTHRTQQLRRLSAESELTCTPKGVALGAIGRVSHAAIPTHLQVWLAVANRRAYSAAQDVPVYVATQPLSSRHPSWDKVILADIIFQHSCAEWVWLLDTTDGFIMNTTASMQSIINKATQDWRQQSTASNSGLRHTAADANPREGQFPDAIIARDCNGINAGSVIFRNSPWGRKHLADIWAASGGNVPNVDFWWEQAAIRHLVDGSPEVEGHYWQIEQHHINAYPDQGCGDIYQAGDIAVHMPGIFKDRLTFGKGWLSQVPLLNLEDGRHVLSPRMHKVVNLDAQESGVHDQANVFNVEFSKEEKGSAGRHVVLTEPAGVLNPGWPVAEPALVAHLAGAYLADWHIKTLRQHGQRPAKAQSQT